GRTPVPPPRLADTESKTPEPKGRLIKVFLFVFLCRTPAIPAYIEPVHSVSVRLTIMKSELRRNRIDTACSYDLVLVGVAPPRAGSRFDTVEVWGSSPHEPTIHIFFNHLRMALLAQSAIVSLFVP